MVLRQKRGIKRQGSIERKRGMFQRAQQIGKAAEHRRWKEEDQWVMKHGTHGVILKQGSGKQTEHSDHVYAHL